MILIIVHASAAEVTVVPSNQRVAQGESFNLNIIIDPLGTPIAGAQLNLGFNKSLIHVNSITEGNLFKQNGADTFFNAGIINNDSGTVVNIFDAVIGSKNVSAAGTFIIINATASSTSGISGVDLSHVKISDPAGF
ncbi:MAG TPA: cohesin domain-containing protein, partial [Candidatus Methanoperedens sp.]